MRALVAVISVLSLLALPGAGFGQQWGRDRHDPQLTGRAGRFGAAGPARLAATLDMGGTSGDAMSGDVDGDGAPDAVVTRGGHVMAVSNAGRMLFDRFVGATALVAVQDVDGDRKADVVYVNADARTLGVVDVERQTIRWQYQFPEGVTLSPSYVRVAELNAAKPGLETIVFADHLHTPGDAYGYFFDAAGTLYARPVVKSENGGQLNFPQLAVANVDGAGDPEVVVVGRPRLMVFDSNGRMLRDLSFTAGDPEGRHYGTLMVANVDDDADLEAIVVADRIPTEVGGKQQAIAAFDLVPTIRELWRVVPPSSHHFESVLAGARDFDGDGRADLAVNHFDGTTQNLEIYRGSGDPARKGQPQLICSLPDTFAWDATDLDGDGRSEIFASSTKLPEPTLSYNSTLAVLRVEATADGCRLDTVGDPIANARYATRSVRALGNLSGDVGASSDERSAVVTAALADGPAFVTYSKGPGGEPHFQFRGLLDRRTKSVEGGPRPGAIRAVVGEGQFLVAEGAGDEPTDVLAFYRWNAAKGRLDREAAFHAGGFDAGQPLAADLDGDGAAEMIARLPGKRIGAFAYAPAVGTFKQLWEAGGNVLPVVDAAPGARAKDVRVFTLAPDRRNLSMLVAHDGNGAVVWKQHLPDVPATAKPQLVLGQFTGSGPRDVWVSVARTRSWMIDGADGHVVWTSASVVHFDNRAAVRDQNGDGADDLVVVTNDAFGVYSGKDAKPLVGPKPVKSLGGDFHSTPILAPDGTMLLVARGTLAKAKVAGGGVWSVARTVERTNADLLVGVAADADGKFLRVGGNFGAGDQFACYDYANGHLLFSTPHIPITDVSTADTDGDGVDEFVFGTADGRVVGLRSDTGAEAWSIDVGGFTGSPIVTALGGGPGPDVLVPVADGTLRVYTMAR